MQCRRPQVRLVHGVIKDPPWGDTALVWNSRRHLWEGLAPPPQVLGGEREALTGEGLVQGHRGATVEPKLGYSR